MKYNLASITKFGDVVKTMLQQKSINMIDKYKESATSSVFHKKAISDEQNKETD